MKLLIIIIIIRINYLRDNSVYNKNFGKVRIDKIIWDDDVE